MESLRGLSSSPASAYDELVTGQKSIRYHWQGILSVIRSLPGGLGERVESARRQLEESGATVNLLDDRGAARWTFDPLPLRHRARRMGADRIRPDPARAPARQGAGRHLRAADAAEGASAAADAGACQPALPSSGTGHRRRGAATASRPLRGRSRAPGRRALARARRPHRASRRCGLRARNASRAGAQPAGSLSLHPGPPSAALRRPLARISAFARTGRRDAAQHGGADAGIPVGRPTSSTSISRASWASLWSRAAISSRATARSRSRRWPACGPSTCCCAASTAPSPIRWNCVPIRHWASPAWWRPRAAARSRSPMRWARAWSRRPP